MAKKQQTKEPLNEIDFNTKAKIKDKVGAELMDMDSLAKSIYGFMPSTSSEMLYRMQLKTNLKIYTVFTAMGFLMFLAVVLFL